MTNNNTNNIPKRIKINSGDKTQSSSKRNGFILIA